jgi:predicted metal-dependent hydrolase
MSSRSVPADLERGLVLMRERAYFEAHEALEDAWRAADRAEKDFFQGLVHVTVAWYQAGRGNRVGFERQLEKAERRLTPFAPTHRGVDLESVLAQVRVAAASGSLEPEPIRI